MNATVPVMSCAGVTKLYGDVLAVNRVSFDLFPGEIVSILGPSGCGKTTLLRLIAGFDSIDSGEIKVQGNPVSSPSTHVPPERRHIGMVFQEYALFPHMKVSENISFGLQNLSAEEKKRRLSEVLDLVRLTGLEGRYPHELSGGQQQRVALARTIAPRPVTVLLDEPFSNLDAGMRWEVRQEIESILKDNRIATIFVTHDQEEAFAMADRVGVMTKGRLEQLDAPDIIYGCPATPNVARLVGACDFINGKACDGIADTEIGNLPIINKNGSIRNGSTVSLLIRPDDLRVTPDPNGNALVMSREFRGGETLLVVQTPSGTSIKCRQFSYTELQRGSKVSLKPASDTPFLAFEGK